MKITTGLIPFVLMCVTPVLGQTAATEVLEDNEAPVFVPPAPLSSSLQLEVVSTYQEVIGGKTVTIHRVKKPDLPESNPAPVSPPAASPVSGETAPFFLTIGSTTYDGEVSYLQWTYQGAAYEAWSNVDFDLLEAVTSFQSQGVKYNCMILHNRIALAEGESTPWHPELPTDAVAFAVVTGDEDNEEAIAPVLALHEVMVAEEQYLTVLAQQRKDYREDRKQWLEANPPATNDVTINLWKNK